MASYITCHDIAVESAFSRRLSRVTGEGADGNGKKNKGVDGGNPPLPTMSEALNRPVMAHSLNGLSTCATTTAMSAATRPTLSPNVDPVLLKET